MNRGFRIAFWWTRFLPIGDKDLNKLEQGKGFSGMELPRTTDPVDSNVGVHDEL